MKWYKFKDKLPILGTNVFVSNAERIALIEFGLDAKRYLSGNMQEYFPVDYFEDDPEEGGEYCFSMAKYWTYPSSILPTKDLVNE